MQPLFFFIFGRRVRPVDPRNLLVLPPLAKRVFVVKKAQLFDDIVHYEVSVYLRFIGHVLLVSLAKLAHLVDVKSLIWIYL